MKILSLHAMPAMYDVVISLLRNGDKERQGMLRITTETKRGRTVLTVEGRVAGASVAVLEQCWRDLHAAYRQERQRFSHYLLRRPAQPSSVARSRASAGESGSAWPSPERDAKAHSRRGRGPGRQAESDRANRLAERLGKLAGQEHYARRTASPGQPARGRLGQPRQRQGGVWRAASIPRRAGTHRAFPAVFGRSHLRQQCL